MQSVIPCKMANVIVSVFFLTSCVSVSASPFLLPGFEMTTRCSQTIDIPDAHILHASRSGSIDQSELNCRVGVRVKPTYQIKLLFLKTNITSSGLFCNEYLQIFDGPSLDSPPMTGKDCRAVLPQFLVSTSRDIYLNFHSNSFYVNNGKVESVVEILLIPFHTGKCTQDEYGCSNGRCIDRSLYCNSAYESCGNEACGGNSHESLYIFIAIFVTCSLIIVAIVACCCYHCKKRKRGQSCHQLLNSTSQQRLDTGEESFSNPIGSSFDVDMSVPPSYPPPPYTALPQGCNHTVVRSPYGGETTLDGHDQPPRYDEIGRW